MGGGGRSWLVAYFPGDLSRRCQLQCDAAACGQSCISTWTTTGCARSSSTSVSERAEGLPNSVKRSGLADHCMAWRAL